MGKGGVKRGRRSSMTEPDRRAATSRFARDNTKRGSCMHDVTRSMAFNVEELILPSSGRECAVNAVAGSSGTTTKSRGECDTSRVRDSLQHHPPYSECLSSEVLTN